MSIRSLVFGFAVAVLALAGAAAPATASTFIATYTGTISDGQDDGNVFGAGNDLAGHTFEAVFKFNTALGTHVPGSPDQLYGGVPFATPSPVVSLVFSIDGIPISITANYSGDAISMAGVFVSHAGEEISDSPLTTKERFVNLSCNDNGAPALVGAAFSGACGSGGVGTFQFFDFDKTADAFTWTASGNLTIGQLTVTPVPEPSAWALMLAGFLGLGGALRLRRTLRVA